MDGKSLGVDRLELDSLCDTSRFHRRPSSSLGRHPIFAASSTQTILSLSSGEAEFYGAVRYDYRTLGYIVSYRTYHWNSRQTLVTDSSACKGLCSRRGTGKFDASQLVQHCGNNTPFTTTDCGQAHLSGKDLAPDIGTKAGIPEDNMWRLLGMFGLAKGEGRAKKALNMSGRQAQA